MKIKMIMAACAAVCSTGAFAAATPVACPATPANLGDLINKCAPEVTFYVGGASAQSGALTTLLAGGGGIFDVTQLRAKITDTAASTSGAGNTVGYIGFGAAGTVAAGKRVLVIYNKANGSAAGVLQLLTGKGTGAGEETTLFTAGVKTLAKGTAGTCVVNTASVAGSLGDVSCATEAPFKSAWGVDAQKSMHLALSDVRPSELTPGIVKKWDAVKFPSTTTGMQGFGVIVNPALYSALVTKNVDAKLLPETCRGETIGNEVDTITAACQPTISKADYASIITGKITSADALLGTTGDTHKLVLYRRVASSGTQAASNIFFAGQAGYNVKTPAADGFADIKAAGTFGDLTVVEGSTTTQVLDGVSGSAEYALGVVSVENAYNKTKASSTKLNGAGYVKIEGISPNFNMVTGALDSKARVGMQNGYPFAFEMQAVKPTALTGAHAEIATKIIDGLKDPAANLTGIAYIGSADTAKNTTYVRNGNNYLPLTK